MSALALEFHTRVRGDQRLAANSGAAARARWAARGGLARVEGALSTLLASDSLARVLASARGELIPPLTFSLEGVGVRAEVLDSRARVHLNLAPPAELRHLLLALGLPDPQSAILASRIADWRDADDLPRAAGGERREYLAGGFPALPKNAPFDAVEELWSIPGVSAELLAALRPYLTVSGDGRINLNSAPLPVLLSLPGLDRDAALAIVAQRDRARLLSVYEVTETLPQLARQRVRAALDPLADRIAFGPREVEVVVTAAAFHSPIRAELRARAVLTGGSGLAIDQVVER